MKHIRDNHYGHVIHNMTTGASQLRTCVKYEENGENSYSTFDDMITKISFGHNTAAPTDLTGLMLRYDKGYILRRFLAKIMDCGARVHLTLKRCPWAPITYDQHKTGKDKRTVILLIGAPTFLLKYTQLKSSNVSVNSTKLTGGAYRNGMGSVYMVTTTEYHSNH